MISLGVVFGRSVDCTVLNKMNIILRVIVTFYYIIKKCTCVYITKFTHM